MRPRTRIAYLSFAGLIGQHHQCDPESLSESQVRDYLLFLRTERSYAASSMGVAFAALRCYFCDCLKTGADWAVWEEFKVRRPDLLPVVMSRAEVARLIGATRCDRFRTAFTLIYHCGLRISKAMSLEASHIRNGSLHIRGGKGGRIPPDLVDTESAVRKKPSKAVLNHKHITPEFRQKAVDLLLSSGRPLKQVAAELGVTSPKLIPPSLRFWCPLSRGNSRSTIPWW